MANISIPLVEIESDARVLVPSVSRRYVLNGVLPVESRVFPQDSQCARVYQTFLPDFTSGLSVDIYWYASGGDPAGTVTWNAQIAAITPGDAVLLDQKSPAASSSASTTVSTAKTLRRTQITIANTDALAAGDMVILKVYRQQGDASGGATVHLLGASLRFVV